MKWHVGERDGERPREWKDDSESDRMKKILRVRERRWEEWEREKTQWVWPQT